MNVNKEQLQEDLIISILAASSDQTMGKSLHVMNMVLFY